MTEYVLLILKEEKEALGSIRCMTGIQIAEDDCLYLRGIDDETWNDKRIRQLPALHSYRLDENLCLFPLGGATPVRRLPSLQWQLISDFIVPELPVSPLPGKLPGMISIQLQATENTEEGTALLTTLDRWKQNAETAPAARLKPLQFAVSANGDVLIWGTPLPSLPGREFYQSGNLLLPSGYSFEAPLIAQLIQQKHNGEKEHLFLFTPSGDIHTIALSSFVKATRSAIRLTTTTDAR